MKLVYPALCVAVLGLSSCASDSSPDWAGKSGYAEPAKLVKFAETISFKVRWSSDIGTSGANLLQPAIAPEAIFAASEKHDLVRIDRTSGKQVWRINTEVTITGGVAYGENLVLIGSDKGDVLAFDHAGKLRWKSKVSSEVLSLSNVAEGLVIVRSGDGRIAGLSAQDGVQKWVYERITPALVVRSHANVAIQRGIAYAGFAAGKLAAISMSNGSVLWESVVSQPRGNTELERISDITSEPVVDDEQVCAISFQGRVACVDPAKGSPSWNRDIASDKGMMLLRKYLYLSDSRGSVYALDKSSGSTEWKNDQLALRNTSAPYAIGDYVVVGDFEGYLHGLKREDGSIAARTKLKGGAIRTQPQQLDNGLLVVTRDGYLYSVSIQ